MRRIVGLRYFCGEVAMGDIYLFSLRSLAVAARRSGEEMAKLSSEKSCRSEARKLVLVHPFDDATPYGVRSWRGKSFHPRIDSSIG
jgi:hypothetical protein